MLAACRTTLVMAAAGSENLLMRMSCAVPSRAALLVALTVAACGGDMSDTTTMTPGVTTTAAPETTTTVPGTTTTTAPSGGVTVDPNLPAALPGDALDWDGVGPGWSLVLYDASRAYLEGAGDVRPGPKVLYVVDPAGVRYEVASLPAVDAYYALADAVGTRAVILGPGATPDELAWHLVELGEGSMTPVHELSLSDRSDWEIDLVRQVTLARPNGDGLIVYRSDGTSEWLERRRFDGSVVAIVFEQPEAGTRDSLSWLQSGDGEQVVVGHDGGMTLVSGDGSTLRDLGAPDDHRCVPVRWWDAGTVLAACYGSEATAPLDDYGYPHLYYGRIWLVGIDGGAGTPLTSHPEDPIIVVDFGFRDALRLDDATLLQWSGDCGSAAVSLLQPDGFGRFIGPVETPSMWVHGYRMIAAADGEITVHGWTSCDAYEGALFVIDAAGGFVRDLAPRLGDGRGVIGVVPLG
jgi:hypothetical protein